jgi:MFS family permease
VWSLAGVVPAAWLALFAGTLATGRTQELMSRALGISATQGVTRIILPYLIAAIPLLPAGYLLGRREPTGVALPGVVLLVIGVAATAFTPNLSMLTVARVLTGIGGGLLVGTAATLVVGLTPPVRTVAAAIAGIGAVLAAGFGVLLGGLLAERWSFRTGFLLALVVGVIVGLAVIVVGAIDLARRVSGARTPLTIQDTPR